MESIGNEYMRTCPIFSCKLIRNITVSVNVCVRIEEFEHFCSLTVIRKVCLVFSVEKYHPYCVYNCLSLALESSGPCYRGTHQDESIPYIHEYTHTHTYVYIGRHKSERQNAHTHINSVPLLGICISTVHIYSLPFSVHTYVYICVYIYMALHIYIYILTHLPDVVLDGRGILFAPFLRDLLTYEREDVKEALGIFTSTHNAIK